MLEMRNEMYFRTNEAHSGAAATLTSAYPPHSSPRAALLPEDEGRLFFPPLFARAQVFTFPATCSVWMRRACRKLSTQHRRRLEVRSPLSVLFCDRDCVDWLCTQKIEYRNSIQQLSRGCMLLQYVIKQYMLESGAEFLTKKWHCLTEHTREKAPKLKSIVFCNRATRTSSSCQSISHHVLLVLSYLSHTNTP